MREEESKGERIGEGVKKRGRERGRKEDKKWREQCYMYKKIEVLLPSLHCTMTGVPLQLLEIL